MKEEILMSDDKDRIVEYDETYQIYKGNVLDLENRYVRKLLPDQE